MTTFGPSRVLLADDRTVRRRSIDDALRSIWKVRVDLVETADQAREAFLQAKDDGSPCDVVMIGYGFSSTDHRELFRSLFRNGPYLGVLVAHRPCPKPTDAPVDYAVAIPDQVKPDDPQLLREIGRFMGKPERDPPKIENVDSIEDRLQLQVQWIDSGGSLERSLGILCNLAGQLLPENVDNFKLGVLHQGLSGAKVFRVTYSDPADGSVEIERVLKLTPAVPHQGWKCDNELQQYEQLKRDLERGGPFPVIPVIHGLLSSTTGVAPEAAHFDQWLAVMYTFLGGGGLLVADFEHVYLDPNACAAELREKAPNFPGEIDAAELPKRFLAELFQTLRQWIQGKAAVEKKPLWSSDEALPDRALVFPPYCFRRWERTRIVEALDALSKYGASLLPRRRWENVCDTVRGCVYAEETLPRQVRELLQPQPVLLAPAHGDMNANNVLLALNRWSPLLIDFACYQSRGHFVQDFARLELAIKLELLGCEERSRPKGKDLNLRRLDEWLGGEDWLARWPDSDDELRDSVRGDVSAERAYALCRFVRGQAQEIHNRFSPPESPKPDFRLSYDAALLYHTIRAVRYDSLPHLKRILAVHCAGQLVERFGS